MNNKISRNSAEILLGLVGTLTVLELTDLEDFVELMIELESLVNMPDCTTIDHLLRLLGSVDDLDDW